MAMTMVDVGYVGMSVDKRPVAMRVRVAHRVVLSYMGVVVVAVVMVVLVIVLDRQMLMRVLVLGTEHA